MHASLRGRGCGVHFFASMSTRWRHYFYFWAFFVRSLVYFVVGGRNSSMVEFVLVAVMVGCLDGMHGSCGAGSGGFCEMGNCMIHTLF